MEKEQINRYIHEQLPSMAAMGASVESVDETALILTAPLDQNHNGHGSAFGASLYSVAMMSCFAAMYLACREHFDSPTIMIRDGQMRYRQPCDQPIIRASCRMPNIRQWEGFFAHYEKAGKTTLSLTSKILQVDDVCAYFDGLFVLVGE